MMGVPPLTQLAFSWLACQYSTSQRGSWQLTDLTDWLPLAEKSRGVWRGRCLDVAGLKTRLGSSLSGGQIGISPVNTAPITHT